MPFEQRQGLTAIEIVVADLAGRGRNDDEIADELGLRPSTVAGLVERICRKLGVGSLGEGSECPPSPG